MNNVSRLLLARAEKAERVLATMVKANDFIESICDEEIAKLKAQVTELQSELDDLHNRYGLNDEEHEDQQVDEEASERESRRLQAYDREQFYRDLDEQKGEVPTY
jgi:hypothetical protein